MRSKVQGLPLFQDTSGKDGQLGILWSLDLGLGSFLPRLGIQTLGSQPLR